MSATSPVVELLTDAAQRIRALEAEARKALYEDGDQAKYRALMAEKCELLVELPDNAMALSGGSQADALRAQLASFAQRAGQALDLDSVFYQAALLYPDDYEDGQDNDLEAFIKTLRT